MGIVRDAAGETAWVVGDFDAVTRRIGVPNALLAGRLAVSPNDVKRVVLPVLRHRVLANFAAEAEGISVERIIDDVLVRIEPPRSDIRV